MCGKLELLEWCNNVVLANQLLLFWRENVRTKKFLESWQQHCWQELEIAIRITRQQWMDGSIESYLCWAQSPIWLVNISSSWVKEANKEILGIVSATLLTRARKPLSAKDGSIEWSGTLFCPISCNTVKTNIGAPRFGLDLQNKHFSARPWSS